MCGSLAVICCIEHYKTIKANVIGRLARRGPDITKEVSLALECGKHLHLLGTLLQMRGHPTPQPFSGLAIPTQDAGEPDSLLKDYLLWNGNIFAGLQIGESENDTMKLFQVFGSCRPVPESILSTLSDLHGPWAFIYWQDCSHSLWFGRDVFGRRSLLWHLPINAGDSFCLSSVGHCGQDEMPQGYWSEVPSYGVYRLQYSTGESGLSGELTCYPWMQAGLCFQDVSAITEESAVRGSFFNVTVIEDERLQVPFPPLNKDLPMELNERGNVGSKAESVEGVSSDPKPPCSEDRLLLSSKNVSADDLQTISHKFLEVLENAVSVRVKNAPYLAANLCAAELGLDVGGGAGMGGLLEGVTGTTGLVRGEAGAGGLVGGEVGAAGFVPGKARVAVLFSGGVDSAVIAALVDRCLPPSEEIDLINVAFQENPSKPLEKPSFQVPDRVTSVECLKDLNPLRKWNLIMVDVTAQEVNAMRSEYVSQLIYPLHTVLDDSVGCALWFGARGRGFLYGSDQQRTYLSQARTLLIGIGADEQLGGYARHRTKFKSEKWQGLLAELEKDTKRLAQRNLGRDDSMEWSRLVSKWLHVFATKKRSVG